MKEKLELILESRGISFYRLSKLTGIGESTLSALRTGKTKTLSLENLELIARALNLSLDEFRSLEAASKVTDNSYLQLFRKSQKLSLSEFSSIIGVSRVLYECTEQGMLPPSYDLMSRLKQAFPDFDLNELF